MKISRLKKAIATQPPFSTKQTDLSTTSLFMTMYFAKGFLLLQTLLLFLLPQFSTSQDTLTISKPIRDNGNVTNVLVSTNETFALVFFSPGKSTYRYVGIRYNKAPDKPVVWVANRDSPINDTSGVLSIDDVLGNLVLHDVKDRIKPIWSTNIVSKSRNNSTQAQLLNTGNLILFHVNVIISSPLGFGL